MGFGFRVPGRFTFQFRDNSGCGVFGLRAGPFGFGMIQDSGFGLPFSGFRFRFSGLGFPLSGLGFPFSGSGSGDDLGTP